MSPLYNQIEGYKDLVDAAEPQRGGLGAFNAAFGNNVEKFLGSRTPDEITQKVEANAIDKLFGHSTEELTEAYFKKKYKGLKNKDGLMDYLASNSNNKISIYDTEAQNRAKSNAFQELKTLRENALLNDNIIIPSSINTLENAQLNLKSQRAADDLSPRNILRADRQIAEENRNFERERLGLQHELKVLDANSQRELLRGNLALKNRGLDMDDRRFKRNQEMQMMNLLFRSIGNLDKVLNP